MRYFKMNGCGNDFVILDARSRGALPLSDTQARAIAEHIQESMAEHEVRPLALEGYPRGQWVLIDYGDVVVHVFYQPIRGFYDLEGLWLKAPRVLLPEPYLSQSRSFVTGTEGY